MALPGLGTTFACGTRRAAGRARFPKRVKPHPMAHPPPSLVLASASPRRQQILRLAGYEFELAPHSADESFPAGLPADAVPAHIATDKARGFEDRARTQVVLTADTAVVLDGGILGKPVDEGHACELLRRLSGRTHTVVSGVVLRWQSRWLRFTERTRVSMRPLRETDIRAYVAEAEPYDKAGAYGIQDSIGPRAILRLAGDYYNVMGLPLARIQPALSAWVAEAEAATASNAEHP